MQDQPVVKEVLASVIPKKVQDEVKSFLIRQEDSFPNRNAYKLLKTEILRIFGPKPEEAINRALSRVASGPPSQLARQLVRDICKKELVGCTCCPAIVLALWKRQLSGAVRAGIAHCSFDSTTFNAVCDLADKIHSTSMPAGANMSVAAVSLDETQPAIPYAAVPEVAAIGGRGRGNGRGGRGGRGNRGGGRGGNNSQSKPKKHPDLPPGEWTGCSNHRKHGKGAYFCSDPTSCPWKDIFAPKPSK